MCRFPSTCFSGTLDKLLTYRPPLPTPPALPGCRKNTPVPARTEGLGAGSWPSLQSSPAHQSFVGEAGRAKLLQPSRTVASSCWSWRGWAGPPGWATVSQLLLLPSSRQRVRSHGPHHTLRGEVTGYQVGLTEGSERPPRKQVPGQARPPGFWELAPGLSSHTLPPAGPSTLLRP